MLIAIISDIHDNLSNLEKCLNWCVGRGVGALICCGDVTNGVTVRFLADNFPHDIHLVTGNCEIYKDEELKAYPNIRHYGHVGRQEFGGRPAGFCHEPSFIDEVLELGKCELVFYGHTHKPWIENKKGVEFVNPGTLGGVFQKATFAVWEPEKGSLELKVLELL